jgi:signal transduction histidine kinase
MTAARTRLVLLAALVCGAAADVLLFASDHEDAKIMWAIFAPAISWSFIGTGLYAWRRRPASRAGALMVGLGFAWFFAGLSFANAPVPYAISQVFGGLWGGVFLHLIMSFPSGRLASGRDRAIVIAGYLIFTLGSVPAMLFAGPHELGCDSCPTNALQVRHDPDTANMLLGVQTGLYAALFVIVLVRLAVRWRRTGPLERLQVTPVYASGLLTFLLVTAALAGAGAVVSSAAFVVAALLPLAFLGGLLRSHVARLDADLRARVEELRTSRARLVRAGDTERRRLERNLHDGAQARLVGLALLIGHARRTVERDPQETAALLDRAMDELKTSLAELRELARGIHPAVLTDHGLEPALHVLADRVPVPVSIDADTGGRLAAPVEIAVYFVVSEALTNVAKYAQATAATVCVRRAEGRVTVEVSDDGIGGAQAAEGSGLRGLEDRVAALDGTLSLVSPPGEGTHLRVEIPCEAVAPAGSVA